MLDEDEIEACEGECNVDKLIGCLDVACDDESTVEAVLDALLRLSKGLELNLNHGNVIVKAIKANSSEPCIVEVGLGCIKNLAGVSSVSSDAVFASTAAALIVDSMKKHGDSEPTLLEQGCLAIEALAKGNKSNAEALIACGVHDALSLATENIENERNKAYPIRAMNALDNAISE